MDTLEGLRSEIAQLKALIREKEEALYRAEQKVAAEDAAALASRLQGINHSLICSFCGVTLSHPPTVKLSHMGCFNTGYWVKGFRKHSDWVEDSIKNGASVEEFYRRARVEKILTSKQGYGEEPDKE